MTDQILKNDVLGWDIINAVAGGRWSTTQHISWLPDDLDNDISMFL